jgi:SPP1 family predicted phage head-tail adaptor
MAEPTGSIVATGQMRERVTLQACAVSVDGTGDPTYAWSDVATLWARVRPLGGGVETIAERRTAVKVYEVTIRRRAGVTPAQRFIWRGRFLEIGAIGNLDERRRRLTLACRDVGAGAGGTP